MKLANTLVVGRKLVVSRDGTRREIVRERLVFRGENALQVMKRLNRSRFAMPGADRGPGSDLDERGGA